MLKVMSRFGDIIPDAPRAFQGPCLHGDCTPGSDVAAPLKQSGFPE
jgi:hypothetical protein